MKQLTLPIIIEADSDGYFVSCPALQGCYSQGDSYEEAVENIKDAIRVHIEDRRAKGEGIARAGFGQSLYRRSCRLMPKLPRVNARQITSRRWKKPASLSHARAAATRSTVMLLHPKVLKSILREAVRAEAPRRR